MNTQTPESAFYFRAAPAAISAASEGKKGRKFTGTPYTGRPLQHPYWGVVVFDVATATANEKTPILIEHDRGQRAGFAALTFEDGKIGIADGTLLENQHGKAVADDSDAGFPWQMSVHIEPGTIEELKAGTTVEVNGHQVHGPAVIFRNGFIREVSFTPTGVDYSTSAAAMSAGAKQPQQEQDMNTEEMQQQIADLNAKFSIVTAELAAATARAEAAEAKLAEQAKEQRMSAVKAMFSASGMDYSDEAAAPYLGMDETTFSAVAAHMQKAVKPAGEDTAGSELFSSQANGGKNHQEGRADADAINTAEIYDAYNGRK